MIGSLCVLIPFPRSKVSTGKREELFPLSALSLNPFSQVKSFNAKDVLEKVAKEQGLNPFSQVKSFNKPENDFDKLGTLWS